MNEFWLITAEHWNECATCKCFAPWPYFSHESIWDQEMQKTLVVQCLYSVKSCSRHCSRQLAKYDANYTKQQLGHNIDICNAKHGAKQHVYFVNDSKQFYKRSSPHLNSANQFLFKLYCVGISVKLNVASTQASALKCLFPCSRWGRTLVNISKTKDFVSKFPSPSYFPVFNNFFGGGLCTGQVVPPREVLA